MGTEASVAPQPEQLGRDILGLERGEADTAHLRTLQQRLQESSRPRLVSAQIAAVIPELGAREHHLLHPLPRPPRRRGGGATRKRPPLPLPLFWISRRARGRPEAPPGGGARRGPSGRRL